MSKFWVVAKNTYIKNTKSWSFFFMVVTPLIAIAVILGISYFFSNIDQSDNPDTLPIVNAEPGMEQFMASQSSQSGFKLTYDLSEDEAKKQLEDNKLSGYLVLDNSTKPIKATYYQKDEEKLNNLAKIQGVVALLSSYETAKTATELNLSTDELQKLEQRQVALDSKVIDTTQGNLGLDKDDGGLTSGIRFALGMSVSVILFMFVIYYAMLIMQEIASEKGSRIMEIILSSMTATKHFMGKLVGIFLVILTHIAIYVVIFGGAWFALFKTDMFPIKIPDEIKTFLQNVHIIQDNLDLILWSIVYGILGIILYSVFAAFLGSLVSRSEDVQKASSPLSLLLVIGFYIGIFGQPFATSPFYVISSHIPLFASNVMPLRIAKNLVSVPEILLSIAIYVVFIILLTWLAATFYRSNVLTYSDAGMLSNFKKSFGTWKSEHKAKA
ncbi:MAG: ABC transporter permease [Aerococcus sp.]|nr:ABC transporter permease [Aerococcus sp.]